MQFIYPELLYALLLLLIPIFIHLFQLRRFRKVDFSNVAFLKKVTLQTRKSSRLKKWLTLAMRLLGLACIILAFAQPYSPNSSELNEDSELVIYIDNSFSMQAKGRQGPLLQRSLQELFTATGGNERLSWFTNSRDFRSVKMNDFKNDVLDVDYVQRQYSPSEVFLKANQLFSGDSTVNRRLVMISDFQQKGTLPEIPDGLSVDAVVLRPVSKNNISIDTAYVSSASQESAQLNVIVHAEGDVPESVAVSLYRDGELMAKTAVEFDSDSESALNSDNTVTFDLDDKAGFNGSLDLVDPNISFDNRLYFNFNAAQKIRVLSINEGPVNYLQRMFGQPEFDYSQQAFNSLNYNDLPSQNFIILNELKEIPVSLSTALVSFQNDGGTIFIIPSADADVDSYNVLLNGLGLGSISGYSFQEKKITEIVFSHPLFRDVFEKQVVNFQYPKVNRFFTVNSTATAALRYEDGKPFVIQQGNSFMSTAAFNAENSNFQNSPLIVPTLYNMAQLSLPLPNLYYQLGVSNTFAVPISLGQDEILSLRDSVSSFIPLQKSQANSVSITTTDAPATAGIYSIEKEGEFLENVSFNYLREESRLQYADILNWEGVRVFDRVEEAMDTLTEEGAVSSYWKWFVIFAVVFLISEMLILKFFR